MAVFIQQITEDFFIEEDDIPRAIKLAGAKDMDDLGDKFHEEGFEIEINSDVYNIQLMQNIKLSNQRSFFDSIAPAVRKGSYIEMASQEGRLFRWVFNGKRCVVKSPTINWD